MQLVKCDTYSLFIPPFTHYFLADTSNLLNFVYSSLDCHIYCIDHCVAYVLNHGINYNLGRRDGILFFPVLSPTPFILFHRVVIQ